MATTLGAVSANQPLWRRFCWLPDCLLLFSASRTCKDRSQNERRMITRIPCLAFQAALLCLISLSSRGRGCPALIVSPTFPQNSRKQCTYSSQTSTSTISIFNDSTLTKNAQCVFRFYNYCMLESACTIFVLCHGRHRSCTY